MVIPDWVSTNAPSCRPDESVHEAIRKLLRWDGESLPVCDVSRQLVGSISMRSVCLYADATGKRLADIQVSEGSEPETPACTPDDRAADVMRRMRETGQWCLPMVGWNHTLIGMVRFRALLDSVGGDADTIRIASTAGCDEIPSLPDVGFRGWSIRKSSRELVSPTGDRQHLTRAELKLLLAFAKHTGTVLSRDTLMHSVCNRDWDPSDRYIDVLVSNLRRKFGERASSARAILTVQSEGYLFTLRVQSPSTRPQTSRSQSGASVLSDWTTEKNGAALDHPQPISLDQVNRLYEERGEAATQTFCVKRRAIASICMSCNRLFRVVESAGAPGGLSHGWCSTNCAQFGTARANAGWSSTVRWPSALSTAPAIRR